MDEPAHDYKKFEATGKSTRFCKAPVFKYGLLEVTGVLLMPLGAQTWQINTAEISEWAELHTRPELATEKSSVGLLEEVWYLF